VKPEYQDQVNVIWKISSLMAMFLLPTIIAIRIGVTCITLGSIVHVDGTGPATVKESMTASCWSFSGIRALPGIQRTGTDLSTLSFRPLRISNDCVALLRLVKGKSLNWVERA
jgi:hypothetical protein